MISMFHPKYKNLHSMTLDGIRDNFLSQYPRLMDHTEKLAEHETIKEFIQSFNKISNDFIQSRNEQETVISYPLLLQQKE